MTLSLRSYCSLDIKCLRQWRISGIGINDSKQVATNSRSRRSKSPSPTPVCSVYKRRRLRSKTNEPIKQIQPTIRQEPTIRQIVQDAADAACHKYAFHTQTEVSNSHSHSNDMVQPTINEEVEELRSLIKKVDVKAPIQDIDEADPDLLNAFRLVIGMV